MTSEREKRKMQERNEAILQELVKQPGNGHCADCGTKGPRWASYNLGCFLCIRCGGLHRRMGTHISKIKSLTLDTWDDEMISSIRGWGNTRVNELYNPRAVPAPQNEVALEQHIRDKYERKQFMSPENKAKFAPSQSNNSNNNRSSGYQQSSDQNSYQQQHQRNVTREPTRADLEKHAWHLQRLKDMGFDNPAVTIPVLEKCNNDLTMAVEQLCTMPAAAFANNSNSRPQEYFGTAAPSTTAIVPGFRYSAEQRQLVQMGFTDENDVRAALAQFDGKVEAAINWLVENNRGRTPGSPVHNKTNNSNNLAPPQQQQQQQQRNAKDELLDIFGDPTPAPAPASVQHNQSHHNGFSYTGGLNIQAKDNIMSLFNQPQTQPQNVLQPQNMLQPQMQSQFQPQAQQSQYGNINLQNNPFGATTANPFAQQLPQSSSAGSQNPFASQQQQQTYGTGNYSSSTNSGVMNFSSNNSNAAQNPFANQSMMGRQHQPPQFSGWSSSMGAAAPAIVMNNNSNNNNNHHQQQQNPFASLGAPMQMQMQMGHLQAHKPQQNGVHMQPAPAAGNNPWGNNSNGSSNSNPANPFM